MAAARLWSLHAAGATRPSTSSGQRLRLPSLIPGALPHRRLKAWLRLCCT